MFYSIKKINQLHEKKFDQLNGKCKTKAKKNWWKSICEVNGYPNTFGYGALKFVIRFEIVTKASEKKVTRSMALFQHHKIVARQLD